jgi:hypothetical protein
VVPVLFILAATVLLAYSFFQGLHPELQKLPAREWLSGQAFSLFVKSNSFWGSTVIMAGIPVYHFFRKRNAGLVPAA